MLGDWRPFGDPPATWLNAAGLPYSFDSRMSGTRLAAAATDFLAEPYNRPSFL